MRPSKRWIVAPAIDAAALPRAAGPPSPADRVLAAAPPLVRQLLANRGLTDPADAAAFLEPKLNDLHEPALLSGCVEAADRIVAAIAAGRKIALYGDYDVDGITGTAILWHAIRLAGGQPSYYVPHRLEEGYGLNAEAVASLAVEGVSMIVTVDCGITAVAEAQAARTLNVELIVTDHHALPADGLPEAACIVHPHLGEPPYPNANLCGAGVALKLAWAIGQRLSDKAKVSDEFRRFLLQAVSLAALGTIADVVPLLGENRVIATFGLRSIKQTQLPGLDALIASAGLGGERVDAYHVGFLLAPRLNAAGRMDAAQKVVEMFTEADADRSRQLADDLEAHNRARQATEREILDQAIEKFLADDRSADRCSIVLADPRWHPGVVGIVASRMVDRFGRPTVLIGEQNGGCQGSARSVDLAGRRFSIVEALSACGQWLDSFGGHAMAGGVRLAREKVADFAAAFERFASSRLTAEDLQPLLRIDALATEADLELDVVRQVARLAPFGQGNPKPVLACERCQLNGQPRRVGRDGSHLQFFVQVGGRTFQAIAFRRADLAGPLESKRTFDLAFEPILNAYQGRVTVELQVRDVRF